MALALQVHRGAIRLMGRAVYEDVRKFKRAQFAQLRKAGNVIRRKQREMLRGGYGPGKKEGRLLSQHRVIVRSERVGRGEAATGVIELFVGPTPGGDAFYGKFHELGTPERLTKRGVSRGSLKAKPWQRDAGKQVEKQVDEIVADSFTAFAAFGFRPKFSTALTTLEKLGQG